MGKHACRRFWTSGRPYFSLSLLHSSRQCKRDFSLKLWEEIQGYFLKFMKKLSSKVSLSVMQKENSFWNPHIIVKIHHFRNFLEYDVKKPSQKTLRVFRYWLKPQFVGLFLCVCFSSVNAKRPLQGPKYSLYICLHFPCILFWSSVYRVHHSAVKTKDRLLHVLIVEHPDAFWIGPLCGHCLVR